MKTVIPAQPGWGVCIPLHDEKGRVEDIHIEPVVAWLVEYNDDNQTETATSTPITATEGLMDDNIIQRPDGSFGDFGSDYNDKDAVLKELERQLVRDEEWRKRRLEREQADRNKQAPPPIPMRNFKATI